MVALVEGLSAALPKVDATIAPRLLAKACGPGRIRGTAVSLQAAMDKRPHRAGEVLSQELRKARYLHSRERRLVTEGMYAMLRHRRVLDAVLGGRDPALVRWLGFLVLRGLSPQDASEACGDPSVDFGSLARLDEVLADRLGGNPDEAAALVGSLDLGLAGDLRVSLGDQVGPFLAASNRRAALVLRVVGSPQAVAEQLAREGLQTTACRWARQGLVAARMMDLRGLGPFRQGRVEVQDEGSQLIAELAAADPPDGPIVDFCAGAGGKTLALAALLPDRTIRAFDVRRRALDELGRRARRAGVGGRISTRPIRPKGDLPGREIGRAGLVVVDAPCSGTGTLRRHPDLRLRLDRVAIAAYVRDQQAILRRAATLVRPGGRLVYATCSVLGKENNGVVEGFLSDHSGFRSVSMRALLPARADALGGDCLRMTPHEHGTDGFFAAVMHRQG